MLGSSSTCTHVQNTQKTSHTTIDVVSGELVVLAHATMGCHCGCVMVSISLFEHVWSGSRCCFCRAETAGSAFHNSYKEELFTAPS